MVYETRFGKLWKTELEYGAINILELETFFKALICPL